MGDADRVWPPLGVQVGEEWRVIDRWWTDAPDQRFYREVIGVTGFKRVEVSDDGEVWHLHGNQAVIG